MKKVLLFILLFLGFHLNIFAQWELVNHFNNNVYIKFIDYSVIDNDIKCYSFQPHHNSYISIDNGLTFDSFKLGIQTLNVAFPSKDVGYMATYDKIYKTIDGGYTWTPTTSNFEGQIRKVQFLNNLIGYTNSGHFVYKTIDGGTNFNKLNQFPKSHKNLNYIVRDFAFLDEKRGIALGTTIELTDTSDEVTIFYTQDGGLTWNESYYEMGLNKTYKYYYEPIINNVLIVNEDFFYFQDRNYNFFKSTDQGKSWQSMPHLKMNSPIHFINDQTGFAIISNGEIHKDEIHRTDDFGINWYNTEINPNVTVTDAIFKLEDDNTLYVAFHDGTFIPQAYLYKTKIEKSNDESLEDRIKIFPNPSTGLVHIIPEGDITIQSVRIVDMVGRVLNKWNGYFSPLSLDQFVNGTYVLIIETNEGVLNVKLVITR